MDFVGTTVLHTLDFVQETEGDGIFTINQLVTQLSMDSGSCSFIFGWNICLNARGRLPRRLADSLEQLKKSWIQDVCNP